jgi:histidinol-phosphate aminotransferase
VYQALLREGVIVRPIASYELPEYLRITIGREEHNQRVIDALDKVLGL